MKRILKSELDKFYTKSELAKKLIDKLDLNNYDYVVEPSCGNGSFYNNISHPNKIGIDIHPEIAFENIIQHDFLTWDYSLIMDKNVISIGNPPFGKQGSLAMKFIKRCYEFSDTIAMILPLSFCKDSVKNRIPEYLHLQEEMILDENSFTLNGDDYPVKCVYQIWVKKDVKRERIKPTQAIGFEYTKDKSLADISVRRVGVYAGNAFKETDKSDQSHYFLILNDKSKIDLLVDNLNVDMFDDKTVGPRSISKSELNKVVNSLLNS